MNLFGTKKRSYKTSTGMTVITSSEFREYNGWYEDVTSRSDVIKNT